MRAEGALDYESGDLSCHPRLVTDLLFDLRGVIYPLWASDYSSNHNN